MSLLNVVERIPVYWWGVLGVILVFLLFVWGRMVYKTRVKEEERRRCVAQIQERIDGNLKEFDDEVGKYSLSFEQKAGWSLLRYELVCFFTHYSQCKYTSNNLPSRIERAEKPIGHSYNEANVYSYREWLLKQVDWYSKVFSLPAQLESIAAKATFTVLAEYVCHYPCYNKTFVKYCEIRKR